jgi:hypothetical protein
MRLWFIGWAACLLALAGSAMGQSTAFNYQGRLVRNGAAASGAYDFRFILYTADIGGSQVGPIVTTDNVDVQGGIYNASLDFGNGAFPGAPRYLEVHVRPHGSASYEVLQPRLPVGAVPYAHQSAGVPWSGISGIPGGFADGVDNDTQYTGSRGITIYGTDIEAVAPIDIYNATSSRTGAVLSAQGGDGQMALRLSSSNSYALLAQTSTGPAIYASTGSGRVAYLSGDVAIAGTLSKGGGSFKIDHPLDPANKYLYHSFVESPDMKNIYDGVVVLNDAGEASVALPAYFEALNRDFRYQLTCIGGTAPVYIAEEVKGNAFKIAGGTPGLKVSWQVTGTRQDAFANAHRIPVEEEKPAAERGRYLYPAELGKPATLSVAAPLPALAPPAR